MSLLLIALLAGAAPEPSEMSTHETRLLIESYGDCVVGKQQRAASTVLVANVSNGELMRRYPQLIDGGCMPIQHGQGVRVKFQGDQYRYALAGALVRRELASLPAPSLDAIPVLDHKQPSEPSRTDSRGRPLSESKYQQALEEYRRQKDYAALSLYGECVVRANPAAARALLLTEPESDAETAQFTAMQTALGTCLREGTTVGFGKLALRGTIAVNYYRLAKAAQASRAAEAAR